MFALPVWVGFGASLRGGRFDLYKQLTALCSEGHFFEYRIRKDIF